jgi:hypothetical protein
MKTNLFVLLILSGLMFGCNSMADKDDMMMQDDGMKSSMDSMDSMSMEDKKMKKDKMMKESMTKDTM